VADTWEDLIEALISVPTPHSRVRIDLIKDALRWASDDGVFRPTEYGSAEAARRVQDHHGGNWRQSCKDCGLERAHPIAIADLARAIVAGELSPRDALARLGPLVLLTREEHRAVGAFRTKEDLEARLGAPLVRWPATLGSPDLNESDRWMHGAASFRTAYGGIETRMRNLAETDGDVFLPNPEPSGSVEYVFICMEPSLGGWARSAGEARAKVEAGFLNFITSMEDFLLHFSIREYLGGTYHITDLSKGAMPVRRAGVARTERYDRWYGLLLEEVDLVEAPGAVIFTVGRAVARHLALRGFPRQFRTLLHYSGLAARARSAGVVGHEDAFEQFRATVTLDDVLAVAADVLAATVPKRFRDETLARLASNRMTESRLKLMFNYKAAFEPVVASRSYGTTAG